jgi:HK97 family phage major capsid protein
MANAISRANASALIPEEVTREIFKGVVSNSGVMSYARRLPDMNRGQLRLPVLDVLPTASFVNGEQPAEAYATGLKPTTKVEWRNTFVNAEEVAVVIPIHENVLEDADYDIWTEITPLLVQEFGRVIDGAILFGTGAPASWPTAIVPDAVAAGNTVAEGTGADLYEDLLSESGVFSAVETDGYVVNGSLAAPGFRGALRGLREPNGGQPIFMRAADNGQNLQGATRYELDGTPVFFLNNGAFDTTAATLITGDWTQLVYSMRKDMTVKILSEGVITDSDGDIVYNLGQQDMVALRAVMRLGWALPNPVNRLAATRGGVIGSADVAGRHPFAVLTPGS